MLYLQITGINHSLNDIRKMAVSTATVEEEAALRATMCHTDAMAKRVYMVKSMKNIDNEILEVIEPKRPKNQ